MIEFPASIEPTLSKALQTHKAHRGTYAKYTPKARVQCDECVNVLHEAKGKGHPPPRREAFEAQPYRPAEALQPAQRPVAGHRLHRQRSW